MSFHFSINDKIKWRTNGRGKTRVWTGVVVGTVARGKLPVVSMRSKLPHGTDPSNRDRYIVQIKDGVFAWANKGSAVGAAQKLPAHNPKTVTKTKVKAKVKAKVKPVAKVKVVTKTEDRMAQPTPKRSGGDMPKTTWYGIVDGKIVSVRKVKCPEGFSKEKPVLTAPIEPKDVICTKPEVHIPESSAVPAAEAPTLPQAAV